MSTMQTDPPIRVLVPIDGTPLSEQALPYAGALTAPGDEVLLLHVAPSPGPSQSSRGRDLPMTDQDLEKSKERTRERTANVAATWQSILPKVTKHAAFGEPAKGIVQAADEQKVHLIAMATHERKFIGRWLHTSVAGEVVRQSPVSVLIVRRNEKHTGAHAAPIDRLIVPLDGTEHSAKALPIATRLSLRMKRPVLLVHVERNLSNSTASFGTVMVNVSADDAEVTAEHNVELYIQSTIAGLRARGVSADWMLSSGDPAKHIRQIAEHNDLIVLTSHGRTGLDRIRAGSVTEELIRTADAPVIVVHPAPVAKAGA